MRNLHLDSPKKIFLTLLTSKANVTGYIETISEFQIVDYLNRKSKYTKGRLIKQHCGGVFLSLYERYIIQRQLTFRYSYVFECLN